MKNTSMHRIFVSLYLIYNSPILSMQQQQASAPLLPATEPAMLVHQHDDLPGPSEQEPIQPQTARARAISPTASTETRSASNSDASTITSISKDSAISIAPSPRNVIKKNVKISWFCRHKETIFFVTIIIAASAWFLYHLVTGVENKAGEIIPRMDQIINRADRLEATVIRLEGIIKNITGQEMSLGQQIVQTGAKIIQVGEQVAQNCTQNSLV